MKGLLTCILIFSALLSSAQKAKNVYFIKNGENVDILDSADFIRVIEAPDSGSTLFKLTEFYKDGAVKSTGHILVFEPTIVLQGKFSIYSPEGQLIYKCFFDRGYQTGYATTYYANGKPKKVEFVSDSIRRFYNLDHDELRHGISKNGRADDDKVEVLAFLT